jgi:RNA polymerase sigma factor (sigma-70 family)
MGDYMRMSKAEKTKLYEENRYYIRFIVVNFLKVNPSYWYMVDDMEAEMTMEFLRLLDTFDEERGKLSSYIHMRLWSCLKKMITKEYLTQTAEQVYTEINPLPESYEPGQFEKLLKYVDLSCNQRDILRLRFILGYTYDEVAEELGVTKQAVSQAEKRAIEHFKKEMN